MIRFIIECHRSDYNSGFERRDFRTIDVDVPQLEDQLQKGGQGEMGFESWRLLGAEIISDPTPQP